VTVPTATLETGNAADAGAAARGWLVGDLAAWAASRGESLDPAATPRQSAHLEVKWLAHPAGDERPGWAEPDDCFSLSVLIDGHVRFDFLDVHGGTREVRLAQRGDYVLWHGPTYAHSWRTASGCTLLTVRWPVAPATADRGSEAGDG
jgi:hypothetical protein